jgi:hypothetical protein
MLLIMSKSVLHAGTESKAGALPRGNPVPVSVRPGDYT